MPQPLGERIRYFREKRQIGSAELAAEIGLSPSAMSLIESGARIVKAEELARIAEVLNISPLAILDSDSLVGNLPVAARSAISSPSAQGALLKKLNFFAEIADLASEYDARPPRPEGTPPINIENEWLKSANDLATWARSCLGDWSDDENHFVGLRDAIESKLFIDVVVEDSSENDVLGAAITDPRLPLLIINANQRSHRALFTLAHELGHVLAGGGTAIVTDIDLSTSNSYERFVNAFAASLLLPEKLVIDTFLEHKAVPDALATLLVTTGVSWKTLVYRLHNLRIINAAGRDTLLSLGLGGLLTQLKNEDLRVVLQQEDSHVVASFIPHWLSTAAISAYKAGVISIRPLASMAKMDPQELLDLISTPKKIVVDPSDFDVDGSASVKSETDEELFSGTPA